jgi:hypothetical protein
LEEQERVITSLNLKMEVLESRVQELEKRDSHWKSYAMGAIGLAIALFFTYLKYGS